MIMVIVSTQIKKAAATAFEREVVETDEFRIVKPLGLMNPIRDTSEYAFEAYSKDYGDKKERNIWQAQVYLTVDDDLNFAQICKNAKSKGNILSEKFETDAPAGQKIRLLEIEEIEKYVSFYVFRKIVESEKQQKVYDLQIKILKAFRDVYAERVDEILNNFHLK